MIGPIEDLLSSDEFEDDAWIRIAAARWEARALHLDVSVNVDSDGSTRARWTVVCDEVRDYLIGDVVGGGLRLEDGSHPAVRQHTDMHADLTFRGAASDPLRAVGALWRAHRRVGGDWIPFERYLNLQFPLEELLATEAGKIADGPRFLLDEYAAELRGFGMAVSLSDERPARFWVEGRWIDQVNPLAMLDFGESFVVAERFSSSRVLTGAD